MGLRDILEIGYFIAQIALLPAALFGLKQLKITKASTKQNEQALKIQSQREAFTQTIEQCRIFMTTIMSKNASVNLILRNNDQEVFSKLSSGETIIENNTIKFKNKLPNFFLNDDDFKIFLNSSIEIMGDLESFSMYFNIKIKDENGNTYTIGDENTAYQTVGEFFLNITTKYIWILDPKQNDYPNLREVYIRWKQRSESSKTNKALMELDQILIKTNKEKNKLQKKLENPPLSKPLGG